MGDEFASRPERRAGTAAANEAKGERYGAREGSER